MFNVNPFKSMQTSHPLKALMLLGALLIVMVGALAFLSRPARPPRVVPVDEYLPPGAAEISTLGVSWDPATETWGVINDANPARRREVPSKALEVAAQRVEAHSWFFFKDDRVYGGFPPLDVRRAESDPRTYRGRPISVVGRLESVTRVDLFSLYGFKIKERSECFEGVIRARADRHGEEMAVTFLVVDDIGSVFPVEPGAPCKVQGVFFKLSDDASVEGKNVGLSMLAKRVFPSVEFPAPGAADLSLLDDVVDDAVATDIKENILNEEPLRHLLAAARDDPERYVATTREVRGKEVESFIVEPRVHRGEAISFGAKVYQVKHMPIGAFFPEASPGETGVDEVWRSFVSTDGRYPIVVLSLTPPPAGLTDKDRVLFRGLFYKRWGYRTNEDPKRAPLVVAFGSFEKLPPFVPAGPGWISYAIGGFILLAVLLMFMAFMRDKRQSELLRRERVAKRQIQRAGLNLNGIASDAAGRPVDELEPSKTRD